jgi:aspartate/methionine/tyrosine aminotransferase
MIWRLMSKYTTGALPTHRQMSSTSLTWNPALDRLPFSPIRRMFNTAATMTDVLHLSIGQPDFPTPPHIIEAHVKALREGKTRYELDAGLPQLRGAVADLYNRLYHISLEPENVLITTGCCQAMFMAIHAVVRPGMEVIVVEPVFVFVHVIEQAGGVPVRIVTTAENGYQVDPRQVIDAMSERTCAVMLNSPGNPTGAVYPKETIAAICAEAERRGIAVISDEVYDRLILDDQPYASALQHAPSLDHLIMTSSCSKTYSMAGLRLGWAISSKANIEALQRFHMFVSTTENTATQYAALAAVTGPQDCVDAMVAEYRRRRDRIVQIVRSSPRMTAYSPGGAFFITPSLPKGVDSFEVAMRLLREARVCTIPGGAFGKSCNNALRISFATSMNVIEEAFGRMISWLERQSF